MNHNTFDSEGLIIMMQGCYVALLCWIVLVLAGFAFIEFIRLLWALIVWVV